METTPTTQVDRRQQRGFILGSLSVGHGVVHLLDLSFPQILQAVSSSMGFSNIQVASLFALRQGSTGIANLGGAAIMDMMRRQWGLFLTVCMVWAAIVHAWLGASPNYTVIAIAGAFAALPGALWHLPALPALARSFQKEKASLLRCTASGETSAISWAPPLLEVYWRCCFGGMSSWSWLASR